MADVSTVYNFAQDGYTKSDTSDGTADFDLFKLEKRLSDAVMVQVAGIINCVLANGKTVALSAVAGIPVQVRAKRITAATTTATGLSILYRI